MNTFLRKTSLFCLSIAALIFCSAYVQMKINPNKELEKLKKALPNADVVMFGSSVNWWTAEEDTDKRKISEMLDSLLPNEKVIDISHGAYHSEVYLEFVKFISKNKAEKPAIIVPINLRYFSPKWDLRPQYQFIKERYEIAGIPYLINFKNYKKISKDEYLSHPVYLHEKQIGNIENFKRKNQQDENETMCNGFILHYLQLLHSNHKKLTALKDIVEICNKHEIDLLMYIIPIDIMKAERLNINTFKRTVLENISVIKNSLKEESVEVLDLSFYLKSENFNYNLMPNEHLNMYGRKKIAERIKQKLNQLKSEWN